MQANKHRIIKTQLTKVMNTNPDIGYDNITRTYTNDFNTIPDLRLTYSIMCSNPQRLASDREDALDLKKEVGRILDGADLTKYASKIVNIILEEKYDINLEGKRNDIKTIVNEWLKGNECRIHIEHTILENIVNQQAKMQVQLDKLTSDTRRLLQQIQAMSTTRGNMKDDANRSVCPNCKTIKNYNTVQTGNYSKE